MNSSAIMEIGFNVPPNPKIMESNFLVLNSISHYDSTSGVIHATINLLSAAPSQVMYQVHICSYTNCKCPALTKCVCEYINSAIPRPWWWWYHKQEFWENFVESKYLNFELEFNWIFLWTLVDNTNRLALFKSALYWHGIVLSKPMMTHSCDTYMCHWTILS